MQPKGSLLNETFGKHALLDPAPGWSTKPEANPSLSRFMPKSPMRSSSADKSWQFAWSELVAYSLEDPKFALIELESGGSPCSGRFVGNSSRTRDSGTWFDSDVIIDR
jgi:hypothetical protein